MTEPVLDLTLSPCAACGQSSKEKEMVCCNCCELWFHYHCVGLNAKGKKKKQCFCLEVACQEAFQVWKKTRDEQKKSRSKKTTDSDHSSVKSDRTSAPTMEQRMKAMEEEHKRQEQELNAEFLLKSSEMAFKRAMEEKKCMWESKLRGKEEEAQKIAQDQELQEKREQLQRMKVNQRAFRIEMASLEKEMGNLKKVVNVKNQGKPRVYDPKEGFSKKSMRKSYTPLRNPEVSKLTMKNLDQLTREEEDSDNDDESWERESVTSSEESGQERDDKASITSNKQHDDKKSLNGLGKKRQGPTKDQLASRSGITKRLPTFSGKPEDWPLFFGSFQASNEACGYSDVENLVRLQESLKGPALEMVRGQLLLPKSVPRVIAKLRQMYGRPEQLLQSHLVKVRKLDSPKSDKLASFVPFGNAVEQLCEHLEAAELTQHLKNPLLIQELVDKLPDRDKRDWVRYKRKQVEVTLRTLTDFLVDIVEEACEANVDMELNPGAKSVTIEQSMEGTENETETLYLRSEEERSGSDVSEQLNPKSCKVCQRTDHRLRYCRKFEDLVYADRMKVVSRWKLCKVCLNEHGSKQCRFKIRCNVGECREIHNPLLHPVEGAVGTSVHIRTDQNVLFRMIPVKLYSGGKSVTVLAFLDEGASVTLMEKSLADRLGVVGVQEELTIKWTSDITRVEKDSRRTNLWASGVGAGKNLLLESVRTVGKLMLPRQKLNAEDLSKKYTHMMGLPISSYNGRPEILIGLNNIHSFAPIEAKIGATIEPIAVRCKLGWTVYGLQQTNAVEVSSYLGYHQEVANSGIQKNHTVTKQSMEEVHKKSVEVSILWKTDNYRMALRRRRQLKKPGYDGSTSSPCPAQFVKDRIDSEYTAQYTDVVAANIDRYDYAHFATVESSTNRSTKLICEESEKLGQRSFRRIGRPVEQENCGRKISGDEVSSVNPYLMDGLPDLTGWGVNTAGYNRNESTLLVHGVGLFCILPPMPTLYINKPNLARRRRNRRRRDTKVE